VSDDHKIRHADPSEGFDRREPKSGAIAFFGIGSVLLLLLTILALQAYFNHIWDEAVYEKILVPPSEQLKELHNREDWNLTHYGLTDKTSKQIRIPVDKAMEMFAQEAAAGKLFYPAKPTVPKNEPPDPPAPPTSLAPPPAAPAPAGETKEEKK
jgi:hypothetical protein